MNKYQLGRQIGKGFTAAVYEATIKQTGEKVAIKVMPSSINQKVRLNEVEILRKIEHKNIIKFYEAFHHEGNDCVVLELCQVGQLGQLMKKFNNKLPEAVAKGTIYFIAKAIDFLNQNNTCHRDLKPANVLFNSQYILKVTDFGFSRIIENVDDLMRTGVGTPLYMSPEVVDRKLYDRRLDIWSLGVMLFQLVFWRHPFFKAGDNKEQLYTKVSSIEVNIEQLQTSPQLKQLLRKCLCRESDRWTARQVMECQYLVDVLKNQQKYQKQISVFFRQLKMKIEGGINHEIGSLLTKFIGQYMSMLQSVAISHKMEEVNLQCLKAIYRHSVGYQLSVLKAVILKINEDELTIPFSVLDKVTRNRIDSMENGLLLNKSTKTLLDLQIQNKLVDKSGIVSILEICLNCPKSIRMEMKIRKEDEEMVSHEAIITYIEEGSQVTTNIKGQLLVESQDTLEMRRLQTLLLLLK